MERADETIAAVLDPAIVRDTIAEVFAHPAYNVSLRESLGERFLQWLIVTIGGIFDMVRGVVDLRWLVLGLALGLLLLVVARAAFLGHVALGARRSHRPSRDEARPDAWARAAVARAASRYTDAAHELYLAVLEVVATNAQVELHPARTAGEYRRELAGRLSPLHRPFAEFAREYEMIIWRVRECNELSYARLFHLAGAVRDAAASRARAA